MGSEAGSQSVIYLVRHGECMGNISRRNLPPDEAVLTDNGKAQAKLLGQHLQDIKFTHAFTSDYARCLETAQIVLSESKVSPDVHLHQDIRLREKYMGIFENGAGIKDILENFIRSEKIFEEWCPEGGESREQIGVRVDSFFQDMLKIVDDHEKPQTILAVTHGATLLHFWLNLTSTAKEDKYNLEGWKPEYRKITRNTGYYILGLEKRKDSEVIRKLELKAALCRDHLKSLDVDTLEKYTQQDSTASRFSGCIQQ